MQFHGFSNKIPQEVWVEARAQMYRCSLVINIIVSIVYCKKYPKKLEYCKGDIIKTSWVTSRSASGVVYMGTLLYI